MENDSQIKNEEPEIKRKREGLIYLWPILHGNSSAILT